MDLLEANIIKHGWNPMLGFDNMLIWPNALSSSTFAAEPRLAGITISKNYFLHTITVTATERAPFAVWCSMPADNCYWFDSQGTAFASTLDTQGGAILVIHDYTHDHIALNEPVIPAEFMPDLLSIVNTIKGSGLAVQSIALNDLALEQLNVTAVSGPVIYFSLRFPADEDLSVLQKLMTQPGFNKLEYIDFTVENRAFYK